MLVDSFGRTIDYVRISVTDHCNLRCIYCMPGGVQWLPHEEILRNEEIIRLIDIFVELGIKKVRFTGGEPLLRKGFSDILQKVRSNHSHLEMCISTNGTLLENYVDVIETCRIQKVNVSLDTLNSATFEKITKVNGLDRVLRGIERISALPFVETKINSVIMSSTLDELEELIRFASQVHAIRFIEHMALGKDPVPFVSADVLIEKLKTMGKLQRRADYDTNVATMYDFQSDNATKPIKVGIIPAISHRFCSRCNRLRLTPDGMLRACLLDSTEYNLKHILRGVSNRDIKEVIQEAVFYKKKEHSLQLCGDAVFNCSCMTIRPMSKIGG